MVNNTLHPRCVTLPEVLGGGRLPNHDLRQVASGREETTRVYPNDRGFNDFLWHSRRGSEFLCAAQPKS